jgi:hypothetical protein
MRIETIFPGVVMVAGLLAAGSARAQSALAEEIWSENFCQQAVSLAKQHGESPDALNRVDCMQLRSNYQPSYWQCVMAALTADARMKLEAARGKCLDEY